MLRTENLCVHTHQGQLLHSSLNLHFETGTITTITGKNGSGKSTLLAHLSGIRKPVSGHVWLGTQNLAKVSPQTRALQIASICQHDTCPPDTLVSRRIAHGMPSATPKQIHHMADALGIAHLLSRNLGDLSGGERKRVFIGRCLINSNATVYILDEPDAGLDQTGFNFLNAELTRLATLGKTVVLSTHTPLTYPNRTLDLGFLCQS